MMNQTFDIRQATEQDALVLAEMLSAAASRKRTYSDHAWDGGPYTADEALRYIHAAPTYLFYVDDKPCGTVSIASQSFKKWGEKTDRAGYIQRLAASRVMKGFGQQILTWAESNIRESGAAYARLDCDEANTGLCAYYERCGYKKVGRIQSPGTTHTSALYEKRLTD